MNNFWLFPLLALLALPLRAEVTQYDYKVIHKTEQTRDYFVQGFEFAGDDLLVGTGGYGQSFIYRINPKTGEVKNKVALHPRLFGEGITVLNDRVYQLTWRSRMGFIYHLEDFKPIARFRLHGEGWGLTNNGEQLILSDGSADVLNGIAWDAKNQALWVTGKRWPWRYQIELIPKNSNRSVTRKPTS